VPGELRVENNLYWGLTLEPIIGGTDPPCVQLALAAVLESKYTFVIIMYYFCLRCKEN
jgi:hypothetical protein